MANFSKKIKRQQGFTLIETFVAITILVIAVLGPMTLLSSALRDSRYIKDEIIATYLAQEGIELVINDRNNNSSSLVEGKSDIYSCDKFYLSDDKGYSCESSAGSITVFSRIVEIKEIIPNVSYRIISTVGRSNLPSGKNIVSSSLIFKY